MLSTPWLVGVVVALSATLQPRTVTAFYPYHYGGDASTFNNITTTSQTARHVFIPPASSSGARAITLAIIRRVMPTRLYGRQNAFDIVRSGDPKRANSVAVDQDGGDLSYMVAVTLGNGGSSEYYLLVDSAASNTWVMGRDCTSQSCRLHSTFGGEDSSTLEIQDKPFNITYGTGSVSGTIATDTLRIGSLSTSLTFGLATHVSQDFTSYPMDGILGIGRSPKAADASIPAPQLLDMLSTTRQISKKLYGIHLSRSTSKLQDGELNLGQPNPARYTGDLNWIPCVAANSQTPGFWEIPLDNAAVNGQPEEQFAHNRTAILDTGTSFILMPERDALGIHARIPGFRRGDDGDGETFSVPCDTEATIALTFNGKMYEISRADWVGAAVGGSGLCRSRIVGRQTFGAGQWLVGDVFLKNVYTVFDFEEGRVGLGVQGGGSSTSTASLSASLGVSSSSSSSSPSSPSSSLAASGTSAGLVGVAQSTTTTAAAGGGQPQGQKGGAGRRMGVSFGLMFGALGVLAVVA